MNHNVPVSPLVFLLLVSGWLASCEPAATDDNDTGDAHHHHHHSAFIEECIEGLDTECTPLYTPEWQEVFEQTIEKKCALGGNACHGASGGHGGLVLDSAQQAYEGLVSPTNTSPRVLPGDAACSPLVMRLVAPADRGLMPPGTPLGDTERCAIVQWIENGAAP